jgi:molybdopterin converting factor small subunit
MARFASVAQLRLFASARDAAGRGRDEVPGATVAEVLDAATSRYGGDFAAVLAISRVWVDGEPASPDDPVRAESEVAVLPPVSGGSGPATGPAVAAAPLTARRSQPRPEDLVGRLFAPVDATGPKVVLGLAWFVVLLLSVAAGPLAMAFVMAPVCAVASLHAARSWRSAGIRASRVVAGLVPLAMVGAAAIGTASAGVVVLVAVAAALAAAVADRSPAALRSSVVDRAGTSLRVSVPVGLVGIALVAITRTSQPAAATLILLVGVYDAGHFLWGAGTSGPLEGRLAGLASGVAATFAVSAVQLVVEVPPFRSVGAVWAMGLLVVILCPLGELVGSALLPRAASVAPAVRRLDSLLLAAPAWALVLGGVA